MNALVCDDDASTRFAARRLLEEQFGCVVYEAADGAEALTLLSRRRMAFMLLDVDMPGLSGHDTLEEVRASDMTKALPVVVLSNERREHAIIRLMQLGISDYLLKPIRPASFTAKFEALLKSLPASVRNAVDVGGIVVSPESPALVADGSLDFRFFFATQVGRYGPVIQAESGAAALAAFKRSPRGVVFVGGDLGVVTAERLATKIREAQPTGMRIVRLADLPQDVPLPSELWDGVIKRSYLPEAFREAIRPYVFIPGPLSTLGKVIPNMTEVIDAAAANVFGTMFNTEVAQSKAETPVAVAFTATLDVTLLDRFVVRVGLHLPMEAAASVGGQLLGIPSQELGEEDLQSITGELANLLSGRLHARFRERELASTVGLPSVSVGPAFARPAETDGVLHRYALPMVGDFFLSITVTEEPTAPAKSENQAHSAREEAVPAGHDTTVSTPDEHRSPASAQPAA